MNFFPSGDVQYRSKHALRSSVVSPSRSVSPISRSAMSRPKMLFSGRISSCLFPDSLKIFPVKIQIKIDSVNLV